MKHLTLLRHAKSSWNHPGLDDFDRPLNDRGKRDAPMMGKRLAAQNYLPDLIISSSAKRAFRTAKIIAKEIGCRKKDIERNPRIYEADCRELLEVIRGIDDKFDKVMLVGHNPGFTDLSYYLTGSGVENIPTCGIYMVQFDIDSWKNAEKGNGKFVSFDFPKNVP